MTRVSYFPAGNQNSQANLSDRPYLALGSQLPAMYTCFPDPAACRWSSSCARVVSDNSTTSMPEDPPFFMHSDRQMIIGVHRRVQYAPGGPGTAGMSSMADGFCSSSPGTASQASPILWKGSTPNTVLEGIVTRFNRARVIIPNVPSEPANRGARLILPCGDRRIFRRCTGPLRRPAWRPGQQVVQVISGSPAPGVRPILSDRLAIPLPYFEGSCVKCFLAPTTGPVYSAISAALFSSISSNRCQTPSASTDLNRQEVVGSHTITYRVSTGGIVCDAAAQGGTFCGGRVGTELQPMNCQAAVQCRDNAAWFHPGSLCLSVDFQDMIEVARAIQMSAAPIAWPARLLPAPRGRTGTP